MPKLTREYAVNFYGGEPLLSFSLIKKTISLLSEKNARLKKRARYSLSTNGSLLTEEIIQFLDKHNFTVELSFDGLAQDLQKKKGTSKEIVSRIKKILHHSHINLEVNSVFTPQTACLISESIHFLLDLKISQIRLSLSTIEPWDSNSLLLLEKEMAGVRNILVSHYKTYRHIPVVNFRQTHKKGIFYCAAGKDRLALSPEGGVWGCFLAPDYFRGKENSPAYQKFFFGTLEEFIEDYKIIYPKISSNYAQLSMDNFSTSNMECFLCSEFQYCAVCPINAALSGGPLKEIPLHVCKIQKIRIIQKQRFRKDIQDYLENPESFILR